ncbi:MAG: hypothetical protein FJY07_13035 [Bacteroidetes bacterium]|nr:hypothetical protein [Bacteroidota bacterium]
MELKFARIISWLIHPLYIPTLLTLILLNINSYNVLIIPFHARLIILGLVFITTAIFPMIFIFFMRQRGMIRSLRMEAKEERTLPFAVAGIFNFTAFYMIKQIQIDEIFYLFLLGSAILIFICLFINFYFKISIHMAGIGGLTGALMGISIRLNIDLILLVVTSVLISGIIGYARLQLKAHKAVQIYTGFLCGLIIMLVIIQL